MKKKPYKNHKAIFGAKFITAIYFYSRNAVCALVMGAYPSILSVPERCPKS
jgi:hypothetical protein